MTAAATIPHNAALPDRFRDVDHLEDVMTAPSAALVADMAKTPGDLIILGVGGKIGPTLARLCAPGDRRHHIAAHARAAQCADHRRERLPGL